MNIRDVDAVVFDLFDTIVRWDQSALPAMEIRGETVRSSIPLFLPVLEEAVGNGFELEACLDAYGAVLTELNAERDRLGIEISCEERFRRLLVQLGVSARRAAGYAPELRRIHMAEVRRVTHAPAEFSTAVAQIAARYRVGLLSNFDDTRTGHEIVDDTGLRDHFEIVAISAELELRKPNPAIFEHVRNALDLPAERILYVGDTAKDDVGGAIGAGQPVVWLSHDREYPGDLPEPTAIVRDLSALPQALGL